MQNRMMRFTLDEASVEKVLAESKVGRISTVGADGYPYTVSVHYWYDGNAVYFHGLPKGEKLGTYGISQGTDLYLGTAVPEHENAMEALGYSFEKTGTESYRYGTGNLLAGRNIQQKGFHRSDGTERRRNLLYCFTGRISCRKEKSD